MRKLIIGLLAVALVGAALYGGHRYGVSLQMVQANLERLQVLKDSHPLAVAGSYFGVYILAAALSLPLVTWLTLGAGALFGLAEGALIVSFGSTIGATIAFWTSRYLFRGAVQSRFGDKLAAINEGIEQDGAFYLFTLRLIPIFPYFAINLLMGLTPLKTRTFYLTSQVGMLAGTLVYVNAGTQLAQLHDLKSILSPALVGSLVLLGLFPWLAKIVMGAWQRQRLYKGFKKPKRFDRNLIVIGAGSAGLVSAYIAAATKAKVTLIEANKMGGDCLNTGCVPSNALIRSAKLAWQIRNGGVYGLAPSEPEFSFRRVMARVNDVVDEIAPHDSVERYTNLGVEVLRGYARILSPWSVEIQIDDGVTRVLTARSLIIATGAEPLVPDIPGLADVGFLTSDTLWQRFSTLDAPPRRLVVLGGGPIGCELAQALARLGSKVTQIERADRLMGREDEDASAIVRDALTQSGVDVLTGHAAVGFGSDDTGKFVQVEFQGRRRQIYFDDVIVALGRKARLEDFGLEALRIKSDRTLPTNAFLQTTYPNIYAAGDVAGPYQFTHTAAHQAWYASVNALFGSIRKFRADYRVIPWTTFTDPEVARVGLSEAEAKARKIAYEVTRFELSELDRAIADGATKGFVKVLTPPGKDRILGATIVGEHAGDLLAEFVLAMKWGLGLGKILSTIHTYPTLAEANKYAAGAWRRAHVSGLGLWFLKVFHAIRRG